MRGDVVVVTLESALGHTDRGCEHMEFVE